MAEMRFKVRPSIFAGVDAGDLVANMAIEIDGPTLGHGQRRRCVLARGAAPVAVEQEPLRETLLCVVTVFSAHALALRSAAVAPFRVVVSIGLAFELRG